METFLQIVFSYPTAVYTVLLGVLVAYWLIAMLGMIDFEIIDGWFESDVEIGEAVDAVDGNAMAGIMARLGLGGLPLMIVLTVLVLVAWMFSYYSDYLLLRHLPGGVLRLLTGTASMVASFVVAMPVAGLLLRPVRKLYAKLRPEPPRSLLGIVGVVRSPRVDARQGIAGVEDGGAGLVLQVRTEAAEGFKRGDRVVLIEHIEDDNVYRVMGEDEFRGL